MDREVQKSSEVSDNTQIIIAIELDVEDSTSPLLQEERKQAVEGILEFNSFKYLKFPEGPYKLHLSIEDNHLVFRFKDSSDQELPLLAISPRPYKRLIQDYFMMVESYEHARMEGNPYKLEAVDMGRRGIHNEGARLLQERLRDKIEMDFETARRFFTLICVLHLGGHRVLIG